MRKRRRDSTQELGPPPKIFMLLEWRVLQEYFWGLAMQPILQRGPVGDGHTVLVIPGFLANELSTRPLRRYLSSLGYNALDWGQGHNMGPVGERVEDILALLVTIIKQTGQRISVIGWSLGGVYARALSHSHPEYLRSVITLGAPIRFPQRSTVSPLYERISKEVGTPEALGQISSAPQVPSTSIYSKSDGVVSWQSAISDESPIAENIQVCGSHCGLGYNTRVLRIIADRLAQTENCWRPYACPTEKR